MAVYAIKGSKYVCIHVCTFTPHFSVQWEGCGIRFGVFDHLKEWHVKGNGR